MLKFWGKLQNSKISKSQNRKRTKNALVETFDESLNVQKLVLGPKLFQIKLSTTCWKDIHGSPTTLPKHG
jgi:hypothetical protein